MDATVKLDLEKTSIKTRDIEDRKTFKQKIHDREVTPDETLEKTGAKWREEKHLQKYLNNITG